jgi:quercetin dioxygenase-like cupin family protein
VLENLRRVITGHDANGRSVILLNEAPAKLREFAGMGLGDAWLVESVPADNGAFKDLAPDWPELSPPSGGIRGAWFWHGKDDPTRKSLRSGDRAIIMDDTTRHPAMHRTNTLDYVVLIKGRMRMLLDEGYVDLNPGDVVVQRGTNHAWTNLHDEPALLFSVMMDAVPGVGTGEHADPPAVLPDAPALRGLKRVVTGHDADGRAVALIDGAPANALVGPGSGLGEIWITPSLPARNDQFEDLARGKVQLEPPENAVKARWFWIGPEDESRARAEADAMTAAVFAEIGAAHARVDTARHPGMHKTRSIDYIVCLRGEVTLLVDEGEVDLKPGDVVIQRGTNHSWVNKGTEPALFLAVLADARD